MCSAARRLPDRLHRQVASVGQPIGPSRPDPQRLRPARTATGWASMTYWAGYNFNHTYYDAPYFRDTPRRDDLQRLRARRADGPRHRFHARRARRSEPFAHFPLLGTAARTLGLEQRPAGYAELYRRATLPLRPELLRHARSLCRQLGQAAGGLSPKRSPTYPCASITRRRPISTGISAG